MVEAKLWRNPESRRKVIGQILDYAAALAAMSYEEIEQAIIKSRPEDRRSIWQRVSDQVSVAGPDAEPAFVDTLRRNLRQGRFLLLVVGDGIRSDLASVADLLSAHPSLGFHLELVELRIYGCRVTGPFLWYRASSDGQAKCDGQPSLSGATSTVRSPSSSRHLPMSRRRSVGGFVR